MGRMGRKNENNKGRGEVGGTENRIKPRYIEIISAPWRDLIAQWNGSCGNKYNRKSQRKSHAYRLKGLIRGPRKTEGSVPVSISIMVIFFKMCGFKEIILYKSRQTVERLKTWNQC